MEYIRARLATLLLRGHGEYLLVLGAHADPVELYADPTGPTSFPPECSSSSSTSATNGHAKSNGHVDRSNGSTHYSTTGTPLTPQRLDSAIGRLREVCTPLKAELNELYRVNDGYDGPYGCWLVRLTPTGVEQIMEVRVAVVGNVDAGKSTTLGVLTRGGLDDGRGKVSARLLSGHAPSVSSKLIFACSALLDVASLTCRLE